MTSLPALRCLLQQYNLLREEMCRAIATPLAVTFGDRVEYLEYSGAGLQAIEAKIDQITSQIVRAEQ